MSYIDYRWCSAQIGGWRRDELDQAIKAQTQGDPPFYGVVMLAMQRADTFNLARLRASFEATYAELYARYNAPGGILPSDPDGLVRRVAAAIGTTPAALGRPDFGDQLPAA